MTISTPGLRGLYTLDTRGKGQKVREYGRLHYYIHMYQAVCLPFSIPSTGYCVTVSTPGLHRVYTLDTGVKGRKLENMADYIGIGASKTYSQCTAL